MDNPTSFRASSYSVAFSTSAAVLPSLFFRAVHGAYSLTATSSSNAFSAFESYAERVRYQYSESFSPYSSPNTCNLRFWPDNARQLQPGITYVAFIREKTSRPRALVFYTNLVHRRRLQLLHLELRPCLSTLSCCLPVWKG